jgi:hypothetical protein
MNLAPSDVIGPEPEAGFDESPVDYDAPEHPDAPLVRVPRFSAWDAPSTPFALTFPEVPTNHPIAIAGEIENSNPALRGALVKLRFIKEPRRPEPKGLLHDGLQGFAKGEGGRLSYHIEGYAPGRPGTYYVEMDVQLPVRVENLDELPPEERMAPKLIAIGRIVVTN